MPRNRSAKPPPKRNKQDARPNLPQHQLPAPYSRLMELGYGDFDAVYDEVAQKLCETDATEGARRLLDMVLDATFYDYDPDDYQGGTGGDRRAWTPLNALRVLGRMGEAGGVGIEPLLALLDSEDDYLREDAPFYYAAMGAPAIDPLARTVADPAQPSYRRAGAGESLAEIGEKHPHLREAIVPLLEQALAAEQEDSALTGFLVISLCDLASVESIPIIEQAFQEDRVDDTLVSLAEVQEHLGLPVTAERPQWLFGPGEPRRADPLAEIDSDEDPAAIPYRAPAMPGRNDPCPCGSGKKYKKCCGAA